MKIIDQYIVKTWLKGWSLSRGLPVPLETCSGFRIDVGWPQQKARYVFPNFDNDFIELANTIVEPWVFLKVCAPPEIIKNRIPSRWQIQPPGYMMTCFRMMSPGKSALPDEYMLDIKDDIPVSLVKIVTSKGDVAAMGRLVFVDDFVIYDRIETATLHRRKGLATIILKQLENIAMSRGKTNGLLVATQEGKALYESLGWTLYSNYTSIVIPEQRDK